jgi:hypothetical protein
MALTLNTTVIPGQSVITDSTGSIATIDYTPLYGRIATALETIAQSLTVNSATTGLLLQGITSFTVAGTSVTATATYTNVIQSASSGTGTGAVFTIEKTDNGTSYASTTITITSPGNRYAVGDTITILGTSLGGLTPTNNLTLTVGSLVSTTSVLNILSEISTSQETIATSQETISSNQKSIGTAITTLGALIQGITTFTTAGTSIASAATYTNVIQSASSGTGTGAVFTIEKTGSGTSYTGINITITSAGRNYEIGDTITILGTNLGGLTPTNDLTLTIDTAVSATPIITLLKTIATSQETIATSQETIATSQETISSNQKSIDTAITTVGALIQGITTFTTAGTSIASAATYTNVIQSASNGAGTGAVFTIEKTGSGTSYTGIKITITSAGRNYEIGNTITLPGALLGGSTPANNLTLTVGTAVSSTPIINLLKTIADNLTALKTLATEDGLKTVGAFDWTDIAIYLNSSLNNSSDADLIGRLETLSKKVPRYFK